MRATTHTRAYLVKGVGNILYTVSMSRAFLWANPQNQKARPKSIGRHRLAHSPPRRRAGMRLRPSPYPFASFQNAHEESESTVHTPLHSRSHHTQKTIRQQSTDESSVRTLHKIDGDDLRLHRSVARLAAWATSYATEKTCCALIGQGRPARRAADARASVAVERAPTITTDSAPPCGNSLPCARRRPPYSL